MLKRLLALTILVGLTCASVACNTVEGAGKDTKHAGQAIENAADRSK